MTSVLETFRVSVAHKVYDVVEAATAVPQNLKEEVELLKTELADARSRIQILKDGPTETCPTVAPVMTLDPVLTPELEVRAEHAKKCLTMCSRMTACTIDGADRLVCGGVLLRPGSTPDEIQANWDLIDTVTGADA